MFDCGSVGTFTTELNDPQIIVGVALTDGNLESCGQLQTSISFRCGANTPAPGVLEYVPPPLVRRQPPSCPWLGWRSLTAAGPRRAQGQSSCITNLTWTVDFVCAQEPPANRPPMPSEGNFALVTFLLIFLGGGLYFVGGTAYNSRQPNAALEIYNNIPHRNFWFDLPSLVSDGVAFTVSAGKHKASHLPFAYLQRQNLVQALTKRACAGRGVRPGVRGCGQREGVPRAAGCPGTLTRTARLPADRCARLIGCTLSRLLDFDLEKELTGVGLRRIRGGRSRRRSGRASGRRSPSPNPSRRTMPRPKSKSCFVLFA